MRIAIGDTHGRFSEFKQLLLKLNFNYDEDEIILLGDLVDYGPEPFEIIFELLKMKNFICIKGNHDEWFRDYIENPQLGHFLNGTAGSNITMMKWAGLTVEDKKIVYDFLTNKQKLYHVDAKNNLFVHAGIDTECKIEDQLPTTLYDERFFFENKLMSMQRMKNHKVKTIENFNEIFIGHTPTFAYRKVNGIYHKEPSWFNVVQEPINICNVWNIDTGAKIPVYGKLSAINIDTHEITQVDVY